MAIPKGTTIPKSSGSFMKLVAGKNKIRFLSDVRTGWEGWRAGKPFRHEGDLCKITPEMVEMTDGEKPKPNINYFWVAQVWNYNTSKVEIFEITQKTIMNPLFTLEEEQDWGDLKGYDINIIKEGEKLTTKFTVQGVPPKKLAKEIIEAYESSNLEEVIDDMFDFVPPVKSEEVEIPDMEVNL